jgi:predicted RNase H-like nuclease (RuvC/YqgF family)
MFRKPLCDNTQDILKSLDKEETKQLMTFVKNFDVKVSELRDDFDQTVTQFKTEISDLKANLCEKQAKIRSLESELASFRGNYKANLEETRGTYYKTTKWMHRGIRCGTFRREFRHIVFERS